MTESLKERERRRERTEGTYGRKKRVGRGCNKEDRAETEGIKGDGEERGEGEDGGVNDRDRGRERKLNVCYSQAA